MMDSTKVVRVIANDPPIQVRAANDLVLSYRRDALVRRNVNLDLASFVQDVYHLAPRVLDLLEIAAYIYAADRHTSRGARDAVEYHRWAREFEFHIRVRDWEFWQRADVGQALTEALRFMSGDLSYSFHFYPGHRTSPASLFDREDFVPPQSGQRVQVLPFSGGLDSLSGAVNLLEHSEQPVCLVSHQGQSAIIRTQNALVEALSLAFPGRVSHYRFECNLSGSRAREETQRTRSFLYCSIAFSIANSFDEDSFSVFENGVTSMNFGRREDLANARASRTTHPQSLYRLGTFFSLVAERPVTIQTPFLWFTKAEVIELLRESSMAHLIPSTVSCTRTFKLQGSAPQCGECFQCIDRRLSAYAIEAEEIDYDGLYATNIISRPFSDAESRTTAIDFIRQAAHFSEWHEDKFYDERMNDLVEVIDYLPGRDSEAEKVGRIWDLCRRHGETVALGLQRMKLLYDHPFRQLATGSLLQLVGGREHLKLEVARLADSIERILKRGVPRMFSQGRRPADENDFNAKVAGLLSTHFEQLRSEHPTASYACAKVVPDHLLLETDLVVESKYLRKNTPPSKASDGIASDIVKYPASALKLFAVYDPEASISDPAAFREDIERHHLTRVLILR